MAATAVPRGTAKVRQAVKRIKNCRCKITPRNIHYRKKEVILYPSLKSNLIFLIVR